MRGLAVKSDGMTLHAECPEHRAKGQIHIEQHRSLLDVQLEISRGVLQFLAAVFDLLEIDADILERIGKLDPVLVNQPARLLHIEIARAGSGTEKAFAKPRAFLVRPINHAHRDRRLAVVLCVDAAHDLDSCQRVEAAVEPSAVRHRIDVAAHEQLFLALTTQRRPEIPRSIIVDFHRQSIETLFQKLARRNPRRCKGDPLRAVRVAGQRAQFLELVDRSPGIQSAGHGKNLARKVFTEPLKTEH